MAIWEPCNYVSNLAYDRLVLEMCNQVNFISLDYLFMSFWEISFLKGKLDTGRKGCPKNCWGICNCYIWLFFHAWKWNKIRQGSWHQVKRSFCIHSSPSKFSKCQLYPTSLRFLFLSITFLKAALINIPYDPVLHDLSLTPRNRSAAQIVEYWLGKLD